MTEKKLELDIKNIVLKYANFEKEKDEQSLFYINQMVDLLFNELKYETENKEVLNKIILTDFKNDINHIFDNLKEYFTKIINNSINGINNILTASTSNRYIDANNIKNIFDKFKEEMESNLKVSEKIDVITTTNGSSMIASVHNISPIENKHKISEIALRYIAFIRNELDKNVIEKNDFVLKSYKNLIDSILNELYCDKSKIENLNLKVINNVSLLYLKEQEYFNINKYIKDNFDVINNSFINFEKDLKKEIKIKKQIKTTNEAKDYLLSFNNTIGVKIKKIFDDMNSIVLLDVDKAKNELKNFNDKISHIYELPLSFDKYFDKYKKQFNLSNKENDRLSPMFNELKNALSKNIKNNISNIFRDNIKIYNEIVYKVLLLKSRIGEYNTVLSVDKVKDLLLK